MFLNARPTLKILTEPTGEINFFLPAGWIDIESYTTLLHHKENCKRKNEKLPYPPLATLLTHRESFQNPGGSQNQDALILPLNTFGFHILNLTISPRLLDASIFFIIICIHLSCFIMYFSLNRLEEPGKWVLKIRVKCTVGF